MTMIFFLEIFCHMCHMFFQHVNSMNMTIVICVIHRPLLPPMTHVTKIIFFEKCVNVTVICVTCFFQHVNGMNMTIVICVICSCHL